MNDDVIFIRCLSDSSNKEYKLEEITDGLLCQILILCSPTILNIEKKEKVKLILFQPNIKIVIDTKNPKNHILSLSLKVQHSNSVLIVQELMNTFPTSVKINDKDKSEPLLTWTLSERKEKTFRLITLTNFRPLK